MYHKVIIMELKENYALVMAEEGQILRVRRKDGMKIGDCIYILEEDLVSDQEQREDHGTPIIHFAEEQKKRNPRKIWKQMVAAAAAIAIIVTSVAILTKPEKAYAMVSVDGTKNVELLIDQKHKVTEAATENSQFAEEVKELKGEKVDAVKEYFAKDASKEETIVVGYALYKDATKQEVEVLQRQLEKVFGTEHILYIVGDQKDIKQAQKEGKSLGMYLAEQAVSENDFSDIIYEGSAEELLELLENNTTVIQNPTFYRRIQQVLSEYEDTEEEDAEELEEKQEEQEDMERDRKEEEEDRLEDEKESLLEDKSSEKEDTNQNKPIESDDHDTETEEPDEPDASDDEGEEEEEED